MTRIFLISALILTALNIGAANAQSASQTASQAVSAAASAAASEANNAAVRQAAQDALEASPEIGEGMKMAKRAKVGVKKGH